MEDIGGHGVLAIYRGRKPGPAVLFRAELDALPIAEQNDMSYRSKNEGVSHKCGHDGHMAILLGLAGYLKDHRPEHGEVYLLFQPAEEDGSGALAVLSDPRVENLAFDYCFAIHNLPGYPLGSVVTREGSFTAAVRSLVIKLTGKTSHAAEPEHGINPSQAVCELLRITRGMEVTDDEDPDFTLITPVHIRVGEPAYGVSAGYGELHLTLRCWTPERVKEIERSLLEICARTAGSHQLKLETNWTNTFFANYNGADVVKIIRAVARSQHLQVLERSKPHKWGEDFGAITQRFPGAMFGLGAGESCPALHNPDYDFPDALLEPGLRMYTGLCQTLNGFI